MDYCKTVLQPRLLPAGWLRGAAALALVTAGPLVVPATTYAQGPAGKAQKQAQPAQQGPAVPADFGTPQGTARIAATAGFLDVVGIKLGMGTKEALSALKSHQPDLVVQQFRLQGYEPSPGVSVSPIVMAQADTRKSRIIEKISLEFTYAPNESHLWSITRDVGYVQSEAPTRDTLLAEVRKKYGPESFMHGDYRPVWLFDAQGKPVAGKGASDIYNRCGAIWAGGGRGAFSSLYSPVNDKEVYNDHYEKQLKSGYYYRSQGTDPAGGHCRSYTVVQVTMNQGLQVRVANRLLEASAVQAAHTQRAQAAAELEKKRAGEAAKRGTPKL